MKYPEELPTSGTIEVVVYFEGYQDSYQNDLRRTLSGEGKGESLPRLLTKKLGGSTKIEPRDFKLLRKVVGKVGRSVGGSHTYKYEAKNAEDTQKFVKAVNECLIKLKEKRKSWRKFDLYFIEKVWIGS